MAPTSLRILVKGLGVTLKSHGISQVFQGLNMSPPPTCQGGPGGLRDQEHGVALHDLWEKVINHPQLLEVRVAEYLMKASCSKIRCKPKYPLI